MGWDRERSLVAGMLRLKIVRIDKDDRLPITIAGDSSTFDYRMNVVRDGQQRRHH